MALVWQTRPTLAIALGLLTLCSGVLPAGVAWVGARLVDAVVSAAAGHGAATPALHWVAWEGVLIVLMALCTRSLAFTNALLRQQLGHRVNVLILEKALQLDLEHFEDSEFYDRLIRARREASTRPLSLVLRSFGLLQNVVSLVSFAVLLLQYSVWAVLLLLLAAPPPFLLLLLLLLLLLEDEDDDEVNDAMVR